jgi:hypothetical protein
MKFCTILMVSTGMFVAGPLPAHAQFGDLLKKAQSAIEEAVEEVIPIEESNSSREEDVPSGENSVASTEKNFESEEETSASGTEKAPQLADVSTETSCTDFAHSYGWNSSEYEQCEVLRQQAFDDRKSKILAMDIDETTDCYGSPFTEMGVYAYQDCQYAQAQYHQAEKERRDEEYALQEEQRRVEAEKQEQFAKEERERKREEYALQKEQEEQERLEREQQEQLAKAEREQARQQYIASLPVIGQEEIEDALSSGVKGRLREDNGISLELGFVTELQQGVRSDADYKFKGDMSCFDGWGDRVGRPTEVQGAVIFDSSGQLDFSFNLSAEPKAGTWLSVTANQLEMGVQSTDIREVVKCQFDDLRIKRA